MARGMPMRPPGGGGRPPQPPRQPPRQPPKGAPGGEQQRRLLEQQRRAQQEQQRKVAQQRQQQQRTAAAKAAAQRQRIRQGQFLHEAHGIRREEEAQWLTAEVAAQVDQLEALLATGLAGSPKLDLAALTPPPDAPPEQVGQFRDRVGAVAAGLRERDPAAVESFLRTVLRRLPLPASFPRRADVAYYPEQEHAVVRMVLPGPDVVPEASEYEFLATANEIRPVPRPASEQTEIYRSVLAQLALLVVRDVLTAESRLAGASFHGLMDGVEAACPLRLAVDRDAFEAADLTETSPLDCLSQLGGTLTDLPATEAPVP